MLAKQGRREMSQQIPEAEFVDIMTNYDTMKDECKELE